MAATRELTKGLVVTCDRNEISITSGTDLSLRFETRDGRVRTFVVMLDGRAGVELSGHPRAVTALVTAAATATSADPNAWTTVVTRAIAADHANAHLLNGRTGADALERVIGGLRYPMLAAAYDAGFATEGFIARWARAALDTVDAAAAAKTAFGARTTRAVVRAMGVWLTDAPPNARPAWASLGLAVAARDVAEPDDLATFLQLREPGDDTTVFSVDDITLLRWFASFVGRDTYRRVAVDVLHHDQVRQLLRTARALHGVRHVVRRPLPARLEELERAALAVAILPPDPPAQPRVVLPHAPTTPRAAPVADRRGQRPGAFVYPPEIRALDGVEFRDLSLCLPATVAQLRTWARLLGNCVGDFGTAITEGASVVVGVRREGVLMGALELDRQRRIVQFVGARNRALPDDVTRPVIQELVERGVVAAAHR